MGWTDAPGRTTRPCPASRRTTGRLAALRARHSRPWGPEDLDERLQASNQIVDIALATDDEDLALEGYSWRIVDRLELGRLSQVDEDIAAFSALASATGDPLHRRDAAAYSAMRAMLEGRFDDAQSAMLDIAALAERAGDTKETQVDRDQRYWMALEWGSDESMAEVEASLKALPLGRAWAATVALLLARTRRYDDAREWLASISEHVLSTRPFDAEWMQMAACALEAGALVRDSRIAVVVGPLLQPYADGVVVLSGGRVCLGSTARFAGLAAATCGDWPLAERNFDIARHRQPPARGLPGPGPHPGRVGLGPAGPGTTGRPQPGRGPSGPGPRSGRRARHAAPGRRHPGQTGREMTASSRFAERSSSTRRLTKGVGRSRWSPGGPGAKVGGHLAQHDHALLLPAVGPRLSRASSNMAPVFPGRPAPKPGSGQPRNAQRQPSSSSTRAGWCCSKASGSGTSRSSDRSCDRPILR